MQSQSTPSYELDHKQSPNSVFELFIDHVLNSSLSVQTKDDVMKIMKCMLYIYENMSYVKWAADHKKEAIQNPRDAKFGVLRDPDGTSFHLNSYQNGDEAEKGLMHLIHLVSIAIIRATPAQRTRFAWKMQWDDDRGCLEARVSPALTWATVALNSEELSLDDAVGIYIKNNQIPAIAAILEACQKEGIAKVFWNGQPHLVLNSELIARYLKEVFNHEESAAKDSLNSGLSAVSTVASSSSIQEISSTTHVYTHLVKGQQGMWQYHFADEKKAIVFLNTVKQDPKLQPHGISKASVVKYMKCAHTSDIYCHIVRLSEVQNIIFQKNTLQPVEISKEEKATVVDEAFFAQFIDIAEDGKSNEFQDFIKSASPFAINQALARQNKDDGWCVLKKAARYQDSTVFQALIVKASDDAINRALILQDKDGWCALVTAARHQDSAAFQALIAKASDDAINRALILQGKDGWCTLQMAARCQDSAAFQALIAKSSQDAINRALILQNKNGRSTLMTAAFYQEEKGFIELIQKASSTAICQALVKEANDGKCALLVAAQYQSHASMQALLQRLEIADLPIMQSYFTAHKEKFWSVFKRFSLYQSGENILAFLNLLDDSFLSEMAKDLENQIQNDLTFQALLAFNMKTKAVFHKLQQEKKSDSKTEKEKKSFSVSQLILWHNPIEKKLERIKLADKSDIMDRKLTPEEKAVLELFDQGKALIKIIREDKKDDWPDFLNHLDYNKRQKNRKPGKPETGYKFISMPKLKDDKEVIKTFPKGYIVKYDRKKRQAEKKDKKHTTTTAHAMTAISRYKHTGLFGTVSGRELVGIVINSDTVEFKTLLTQDRNTYAREWIAEDLNDVVIYAQRMQYISHTNWEEFQQANDQQPFVVNEALGKLTRESIPAIVIGKDTPKARKIALKRQPKLEARLGRKIPIVMYNSILGKVSIFSRPMTRFDPLDWLLNSFDLTRRSPILKK